MILAIDFIFIENVSKLTRMLVFSPSNSRTDQSTDLIYFLQNNGENIKLNGW